MTEYKIYRWDARLIDETIYPEIYIKPDSDLLNFFKNNNNLVLSNITESESIYDNRNISSTVVSLEQTRPNYFEKTGYYTVILNSNWYGYPEKLGKVVFSVLDNKKEKKSDKEDNKPDKHCDKNNENCKINKQINFAYIIVIFLILVMLFVYQKVYIKK